MWSNKPSTDTLRTAAPSESGPVVDSQAPGQDNARPGIAGGLRIVGQIQGRGDLFIAGEVHGTVFLPACKVQVGPHANVSANMNARVIEIEGRVTGDLTASERIAIKSSGVVTGDVVSPQIQIDEGCRFKGSVQMREPESGRDAAADPRLAADTEAVRYKAANE